MYEGVVHGVLAQPWSLNNSLSKHSINNMVSSTVDLQRGSNCDNIGSCHIIDAEDFFIDDLSEFSNEDLAAPIKNHALLDPSSLMQHQISDDNTSASHDSKVPSAPAIKSDCNTSPSGSVLLHDSALDYKTSLHIDMESSLSLPCQDETGFEWLTSFGEDNLIYGAGMDSFLLSNAEPFDGYDGLMKHGGYEDDSKVKVGLTNNGVSTNVNEQGCGGDHFKWNNQNGVKEVAAMMFMPHSTGSRSARTKRARSTGWSSSNILCNNWDNNSPTNSLNSSSEILPNPPYSSPTFLPKQEENHEQHGYAATHSTNLELITSSLSAPDRDKSFSKASKFCSNDQALNDWAKEEENTREESVSNYSGLQPRRCMHCLSQKTPQWRAGPGGPKTLCNACGVRYKSGRLFDEYRPAKSPTFLSYKHSNSHKKVMEMRRRKTFQYNHHHQHHHHHHHHHHHAAQHTRAPPPPVKHAEVDPHLGNKLKIKLNPSTLEPHSHFSDITLISTRTALESPASFLY